MRSDKQKEKEKGKEKEKEKKKKTKKEKNDNRGATMERTATNSSKQIVNKLTNKPHGKPAQATQ